MITAGTLVIAQLNYLNPPLKKVRMNKLVFRLLLLTITMGTLTGCNRNAGPPPPLAAEQFPAEFKKAFAKAPEAARALSTGVIETMQQKNYTAAYEAVQALVTLPNLTKEQQSIATRASLTINGLLQTAQNQGDQGAATALRTQRSNR